MMCVDKRYSTRAISIYKALYYAEKNQVKKSVLDCGAGGMNPPLHIFFLHGYDTAGIDIDEGAIKKATEFEVEKGCALHIQKGDMRKIAKEDNSTGCCYSHNSVFHMTKSDILKSIKEMFRITENAGIVYFNLLSVNDKQYGEGTEIEENTFLDESDGVIHSYHKDNEIDKYLADYKLLEKAYTNTIRNVDGRIIDQSFIEYYLKKQDAATAATVTVKADVC